MKWRWGTVLLLALGICLLIDISSSHVRELSGKLTLLHSNNINGEIDPCPS